ncbi:MAG: hypothetical protein ACI8ZN_000518 [Bacteroidia bacterium]|jgi:hypothetical protein
MMIPDWILFLEVVLGAIGIRIAVGIFKQKISVRKGSILNVALLVFGMIVKFMYLR